MTSDDLSIHCTVAGKTSRILDTISIYVINIKKNPNYMPYQNLHVYLILENFPTYTLLQLHAYQRLQSNQTQPSEAKYIDIKQDSYLSAICLILRWDILKMLCHLVIINKYPSHRPPSLCKSTTFKYLLKPYHIMENISS